MKNRYSGTEVGKDQVRAEACQYIKQFNLPDGQHPEPFIRSLLLDKEGELPDIARTLTGPFRDFHGWLEAIVPLQGDIKAVCYNKIISIAKTDPQWSNYIQPLQRWIVERKKELGAAKYP